MIVAQMVKMIASGKHSISYITSKRTSAVWIRVNTTWAGVED
jgi:hypothetical protein